MSPKTSILFVVNPISGGKSKKNIPQLIDNYLDSSIFSIDIFWWNKADELLGKVNHFIESNGEVVIAVGGDGTINLLASMLSKTNVALGIIPMGSGNGLARELGISMNPQEAIKALNSAKIEYMDLGLLNGKVFCNVAGIGFAGQVVKTFSTIKRRGLFSYILAVKKEFNKAQNTQFEIKLDETETVETAFMLDVANGTQWGNNFFVAPDASYTDGELDFVFLKKPKMIQIPAFVWSLLQKKNHKLIKRYRLKEATITLNEPLFTHLDGECQQAENQLTFSIIPSGLKLFR
ncbi:MAG: hypothetical protein H6607_10630 [Flavobacteriales bacterium]|nr:hypothetical protein [Flavobacteriales bacterium]